MISTLVHSTGDILAVRNSLFLLVPEQMLFLQEIPGRFGSKSGAKMPAALLRWRRLQKETLRRWCYVSQVACRCVLMSNWLSQPASAILGLLVLMQAQLISGQPQHVSHAQCLSDSGKECSLYLLVEGIADQLVLLCGRMDLQAHPHQLQPSLHRSTVQRLANCQHSTHVCQVKLSAMPLAPLLADRFLMQITPMLGQAKGALKCLTSS